MILSLALRTSFRSLSSTHVSPAAVHKSLAFGSTQIRRLGLPIYRAGSGPIDPDPTDDPKLFDVLLPGLNYHIIHEDISKELGYRYLSRVPKHEEFLKPSSEIRGILYGIHHRPFFPLITTLGDRSHFLHFLFDCGSPYTYLSYEACDVFFGDHFPKEFSLKLNGHTALIRPAPATSHFKDVNLLGADFCAWHNVFAGVDYKTYKAKLIFQDLAQNSDDQN